MEGKALIIINPKSGTRTKFGIETAIENVFGSRADIVFTERPGHATELAAAATREGYDRVVAVGGDGTVNETANGLLHTNIPLAIIPFGSGNGLARDIGIPMKRDAALEVAAAGKSANVDCGTVGGKNFFCTMGVGFDALVSQEFAHAQRRGLLAYSRIAVNNFMRYKPQNYNITVDDTQYEFKAFIIAVCNAAQYGNNAFIAPHASMSDGKLDVTVVERGHLGSLATAGVRLFTHNLDRSHIVHCLRGKHILIQREYEGPGHIDGEAVTLPAELDISCQPGVLKVIVPE
ncbi:MAG: diacylglycerol kinase family lipid kinase [Prevotella sp.]|nr:diacylglycerol kinase family lipid kinase [Prevotella sp.]MCM1074763.1 diacylglycerol kinase family lipid kinase [Ruminococcus sp.]